MSKAAIVNKIMAIDPSAILIIVKSENDNAMTICRNNNHILPTWYDRDKKQRLLKFKKVPLTFWDKRAYGFNGKIVGDIFNISFVNVPEVNITGNLAPGPKGGRVGDLHIQCKNKPPVTCAFLFVQLNGLLHQDVYGIKRDGTRILLYSR